jgi:D-glycero-alpha-D-manno-heptose-7-phosphate kinase
MLFFTGISRFSYDIAAKQMETMRSRTKDLLEMKRLVDEAENILTGGSDISEFGCLLDYTWRLKKGMAATVSTDYIDALYDKAKLAGAPGGKLLGSGGGGFLLLFVPPEYQRAVKSALSELLYVPFKFENFGTRVIYFAPEDYSPILENDNGHTILDQEYFR